MKRLLMAAYGGLSYLGFLLPIAYLVGFIGDVGVPKSVDRGAGPLGPSVWVDIVLIAAFGIQHSLMARPGFKARVQRWIPEALERSTYTLASGVVLALVFWLWRPIPAVLWDVDGTWLGAALGLGQAAGWGLAVWATFAISHFHLFGVAQAAAHARGGEPPRMVLRTSLIYRIVRHPMTAGLMLVFWCAPRMTTGHLLFAGGMTVYSLLATILEERDLVRLFPERYQKYRREVPALIPALRPAWLLPRRGGLAVELAIVAAGILAGSHELLGKAFVVSSVPAAAPLERRQMSVGGRTRTYALFAPTTEPDGPRALVLGLHGTGGNARRIQTFLGGELERRAAERGWVVAYPEAIGGSWNDCRGDSRARGRPEGPDDVAFLGAVIGQLRKELGIDLRHVFLLGYSGGGHMALRVALEAPRLVRGIAVFGANLPGPEALQCNVRGGSTAVMVVNGARDLVNPLEGGDVITPSGVSLGPVRSTAQTAAFFRNRGAPDVVAIVLPRGGHSVPGTLSNFPGAVGATVRTFEGVREALEFFGRQ